jgi:hypothetical protein
MTALLTATAATIPHPSATTSNINDFARIASMPYTLTWYAASPILLTRYVRMIKGKPAESGSGANCQLLAFTLSLIGISTYMYSVFFQIAAYSLLLLQSRHSAQSPSTE